MTAHPPRALLIAMMALAAACTSDDAVAAPAIDVQVQATTALTFSPATVDVAPGDTVTWVFESIGHNVAFDSVTGAPASITGRNENVSISRIFPITGTYRYHCTIHPSMTGTVIVTAHRS